MRSQWPMMASVEAWGEADLGGRLALLGCDGYCVFAHSVNGVECAREVWAHGVLLFFLIQKKPAIVPNSEASIRSSGMVFKSQS